ncbi:MAG: hypothetical protein IT419_00715 [Planctomycetes bacterium]|nr:hypothetical protein [Planctomycetota bacterium]
MSRQDPAEFLNVVPRLAVGAREGARMVGVSVRTWWRLFAMGALPPSFKIKTRRLWRVYDIAKSVEAGFPKDELMNGEQATKGSE